MLAVVILNTIVLSTDGYFQDPEQIKLMETINTYMVYIFAVEMSLKIMGYGFYGISIISIIFQPFIFIRLHTKSF